MKLKLYYPTKPYIVTQAWGVLNGAYQAAGLKFSRHNGEDARPGKDNSTYFPFKAEVIGTGYNDMAGNFVRLMSTQKYEVGGVSCYVGAMFMHHEKILCTQGQIGDLGDVMGVCDNTGFSTGPHTHGSYIRFKTRSWYGERYDTDEATDRTFDPHPYWTGFASQDAKTVLGILQQMIGLLKK